MPRGLSAKQLAPLRLAGFRLLFLSILGSSVGTFLAAIALAIDVKDRTNSGLWVGAVLVVEFLPAIFVGLTLGLYLALALRAVLFDPKPVLWGLLWDHETDWLAFLILTDWSEITYLLQTRGPDQD